MCLMVCLPPGVRAGPEVAQAIRAGRLMNDDGAGFCVMEQTQTGWIAHGAVMLDNAEWVIEQFLAMRALYPTGPAMLHLRWGTCGRRVLANVQPWQLSSGIVLGMTGHYFDVQGSHGLADARIIAERMKHADLRDPRLREGLEAMLPEACTMALIVDGQLHIYGAGRGYWVNGAWFSNSEFIHPGASDGDHAWTKPIEADIELKRLYRKLGNALTRPDLCPNTASEISSLRGDIIAARPQLARGVQQACPG